MCIQVLIKQKKRAVDESVISRLCKLDLSSDSNLELTRDIFIFSYCARGMAFVDIAFLKKKNIEDNIISYSRHKTGQLLTVKIEPNMKNIIDKYSNLVKESPYVFPFLTSIDANEAYNGSPAKSGGAIREKVLTLCYGKA